MAAPTDMANGATAEPKSWRDVYKIHPAAEKWPILPADELRAIGEDIRANGMHNAVTLWRPKERFGADWLLLDGRNRLDAMELVGLETVEPQDKKHPDRGWHLKPFAVKLTFSYAEDPWAETISLNAHRRHQTAEAKREAIAAVLMDRPDLSDREIARRTGASPTTVGKVRGATEPLMSTDGHKPRTEASGRKARGVKPGAKPAAPKTAPAAVPSPDVWKEQTESVVTPPSSGGGNPFAEIGTPLEIGWAANAMRKREEGGEHFGAPDTRKSIRQEAERAIGAVSLMSPTGLELFDEWYLNEYRPKCAQGNARLRSISPEPPIAAIAEPDPIAKPAVLPPPIGAQIPAALQLEANRAGARVTGLGAGVFQVRDPTGNLIGQSDAATVAEQLRALPDALTCRLDKCRYGACIRERQCLALSRSPPSFLTSPIPSAMIHASAAAMARRAGQAPDLSGRRSKGLPCSASAVNQGRFDRRRSD